MATGRSPAPKRQRRRRGHSWSKSKKKSSSQWQLACTQSSMVITSSFLNLYLFVILQLFWFYVSCYSLFHIFEFSVPKSMQQLARTPLEI
jgi:hypothetical protein